MFYLFMFIFYWMPLDTLEKQCLGSTQRSSYLCFKIIQKNKFHKEVEWVLWKFKSVRLSRVWSSPGDHGFTIHNHLHKENKERADDTVLYLHGLRLVHGFDCILCHCPCRKCNKRTACGNKGTGSRKDKKQQDKRVGRLLNQHSLRERPQDDTVLSST